MFTISLLSVALLVAAPAWGQRAEQDEDPRGVQIIKQINRVNEDGTYTYGYEAADGSFKIETRDVLGNVKGMFGYVDNNGELKRVSYSAANGTGFQATEDYGSAEHTTRRPIPLYRGTTPHQIQRIPLKQRVSTTPVYEYGTRRPSQVQEFGGGATEAPQRPVRVLVTKRPLGPVLTDTRSQETGDVERNTLDRNNVIRRQLGARDNQELGGAARAIPLPRDYGRYNQQGERPDQREIYRNMLLEQNNLKPDYPPPRSRYYSPGREDSEEGEYPEVGAVVPMVNRVLGSGRPRPRQTFLRPPPSIVDENAYPVLPPPIVGRRPPYRGAPPVPPRVPALYDPYNAPIDYEALREEIMNYLIDYIQYRTRGYNGGYNSPYSGGYNGPNYNRYNRPYLGGYDPTGAGPIPGAGYYQPRIPPYQQDYYNQRFYSGRIGAGVGPQLPPGPPPPVTPLQPGVPLGQPIYPPYGAPGPYGQAGPYGQGGPYGQPVGPAASYPYVNPNVQYSSSEDASGTTTASTTTQATDGSETLAAFKERMDASDHRDAADTRPPSPGIFKLLLARPHTSRTQLQRPSVRSADPLRLEPIRSVEILGTAASENRPPSTTTAQSSSSTTTTEADPMIASP